MAILLQVIFALIMALIVMTVVGMVIRKLSDSMVMSALLTKSAYALTAAATFVLAFREVGQAAFL